MTILFWLKLDTLREQHTDMYAVNNREELENTGTWRSQINKRKGRAWNCLTKGKGKSHLSRLGILTAASLRSVKCALAFALRVLHPSVKASVASTCCALQRPRRPLFSVGNELAAAVDGVSSDARRMVLSALRILDTLSPREFCLAAMDAHHRFVSSQY